VRVWFVLVLAACIPAPDPINLTGVDPSAYFDTGGELPGVGTSTSSGVEDGSEDGDPPVASTTTTGSTGESVGTASDESSSTGELPLPSFPEPSPFGDDVAETALVSTWTSPWVPDGLAHVSLAIDADGRFTWTEASAGCGEVYSASGVVWVEATQLVFHVEVWDKRDPWPLREPLELPFRMRLPYAVIGGVMGLGGDEALTEVRAWQGRGYDRVGSGSGPASSWGSSAELWGLIRGEPEPRLIVRDAFEAELAGGGAATVTLRRSWAYPDAVDDAPVADAGTWLDHHPGYGVGAVTVVGVGHAYSPSSLATWDGTRGLKQGVVPSCG
jgi:hypothetical protein